MLSLTAEQITQYIGLFWWPFCRVLGAFIVLPVFSHTSVPMQTRVLFAFALSMLVAPTLPDPPAVDPLTLAAAVLTFEQIFIGLTMGLFMYMMQQVLGLFGAIISMQMGLSMAMVNDPASGASEPVIGFTLILYGTLLFLGLDGHLVALGILHDSFDLWPIGKSIYLLPMSQLFDHYLWMFATAFMLSLPAIFAMLVVNITFGILSRSAPQLNIFALGFPMTMIMGMIVYFLSFSELPSLYSNICIDALNAMALYIQGTP